MPTLTTVAAKSLSSATEDVNTKVGFNYANFLTAANE